MASQNFDTVPTCAVSQEPGERLPALGEPGHTLKPRTESYTSSPSQNPRADRGTYRHTNRRTGGYINDQIYTLAGIWASECRRARPTRCPPSIMVCISRCRRPYLGRCIRLNLSVISYWPVLSSAGLTAEILSTARYHISCASYRTCSLDTVSPVISRHLHVRGWLRRFVGHVQGMTLSYHGNQFLGQRRVDWFNTI